MTHPLINPDSTHYQMIDGVESIERLEEMFTKEELAVWAKITAMKYRMRIGNKDDADKEVTKIKGYEAYYKFLTEVTLPEEDVNEDVYNVCACHPYDCKCPPCMMLNSVGQELSDKKRKYQYDKKLSDDGAKGQIMFVLHANHTLRDAILRS